MQGTRRRPRSQAHRAAAFSIPSARLGVNLPILSHGPSVHRSSVSHRTVFDASAPRVRRDIPPACSHFFFSNAFTGIQSRRVLFAWPAPVVHPFPLAYATRLASNASVQRQSDKSKKKKASRGGTDVPSESESTTLVSGKQATVQPSSAGSSRKPATRRVKKRAHGPKEDNRNPRQFKHGSRDENNSSPYRAERSRRKGRRDTSNRPSSQLSSKHASSSTESRDALPSQNDFNISVLTEGHGRQRALSMQALRSGMVKLTVEQFNEVVSSLSRQRKISEALEVVGLAEHGPLKKQIEAAKSVKACTIMIDVYGKGFQLSRAFSLFYGMARNGVDPNLITYNAMIAACARNNEPDLAYEVFEEMQVNGLRADKFTYGSLIDSCAKCGQVDRAFEISRMMDRNGVDKDQTIYSALMDACGRTEQLERALVVFEEMKRKGVWPNLITFSVLIDTCANAREPELAFQIYSEVKHWGYNTANVVVFTALIDACAKSGWAERAELVMQTMVSHGIKPNQITFGALLEGWAREGRVDRALDILDRMVSEHGVLPNSVVLGGLIDASRRLREHWRVGKLWEVIMQFNLRPSKMYYPSLIGMALCEGDLPLATSVMLHAYARGCFRRAALYSEDPSLHAIACAIVYYRYEVLKKVDLAVGNKEDVLSSAERVGTLYKSIGMSERDLDSMSLAEARNFCLTWGDNEGKDGAKLRNGTRKDRKGVFRKDSFSSAAARSAKEAAAAAASGRRGRL